jgi:hypothetical protein
MVGAERAWHLDLHRLRRGQGIVQARTLTYQRFVRPVELLKFQISYWKG